MEIEIIESFLGKSPKKSDSEEKFIKKDFSVTLNRVEKSSKYFICQNCDEICVSLVELNNHQRKHQSSGKAKHGRVSKRQNQAEKRRRDKINHWMNKISRILPNSPDNQTKEKVLENCYEHIIELQSNFRLIKQHSIVNKVGELVNERNELKNEVTCIEFNLFSNK